METRGVLRAGAQIATIAVTAVAVAADEAIAPTDGRVSVTVHYICRLLLRFIKTKRTQYSQGMSHEFDCYDVC